MELNLDTGRLWVFLAGFGVMLLLESLVPARPAAGTRARRLVFHGLVAALNTTIVRMVAYVPLLLWAVHVEEEGYGLARWLGLVGWAEIIISIIVLDAFDYAWHRANHRWRLLWRFHKAHHADTAMDVTTALRFHPFELLVSSAVKAVWLVVWGPTVVSWFLFQALVSLCAQFHHANVDLPDPVERWLGRVLVTPHFHAAHHRVERHLGNANFSTILPIWDRLFGSYSAPPPSRQQAHSLEVHYGLPEGRDVAFRAGAWLVEPFSARNLDVDRR
jgi:sterol desaturase/sphingolipid hydroxylase (fatty acid hydroxylase superfamily)